MELKEICCPNCNAKLQIPEDRDKMFCSFCGTQLYINNNEMTVRYIDEVKLMEFEYRKETEKKRKELVNKRIRKWCNFVYITEIIAVILVIITFLISLFSPFSVYLLLLEVIYVTIASILIGSLYPSKEFEEIESSKGILLIILEVIFNVALPLICYYLIIMWNT